MTLPVFKKKKNIVQQTPSLHISVYVLSRQAQVKADLSTRQIIVIFALFSV